MTNSFQNEIPKERVNIRLDLHIGGAQKKVELPLKLLVTGTSVTERKIARCQGGGKTEINKNNYESVLAEFSPELKLYVENMLALYLHLSGTKSTTLVRKPGTSTQNWKT
ncbi:type VI secretion system contractile sheath small subunit [Citrobacter braakii]|nr:type VI secretion system contractile sheath small subunit [Citrobacter braakii]MBJ8903800.1 type VI secretion system contractile sheath small subunit [Citrobacter braakii]MBJ8907522.1 type VI secretion system contractile sheath small subunit [Citrobacter braakii]MBJ8922270.1 type VI secretion system contractile sheath small subunit [Citrobacter braakii]